MKFARYWLSLILGFAAGGILSLKISGTPMRDLLSTTKAESSSTASPDSDKLAGGSVPLAEDERFTRFFSAVQETRALKRRSDLHSAIGDLGPQDMEPLIKRIEALRWTVNSHELIEVILNRWIELDRDAAIRWIRSRPEVRSHQVLWARTSPESALKEIAQTPQMQWGEEILLAAVNKLTSDDDQRAQLILQLPDSIARNNVLVKMTNELAGRDRAQALKFAQQIPDTALRASTMANVLSGWTRNDAEGAAKEVSARLSEIENTRQFDSLLSTIVGAFANKDVNSAFEWIGTLPEHHRSAAAYSSAAAAWAAKNPIEALQWCMANGVDPAVSFVPSGSGAVVTRAMYANPAETLHWIQSQPPGEARDALLERALMTRLRNPNDLIGAHGDTVFQAMQSLPSETQFRLAAMIAKASGGDTTTAQFAGWLERFPDPALRAATITGSAEANGVYSMAAVNNHAMQFAEGANRDAALRGLANNFRNRSNPRLAAETAAKISDSTLQLSTLDTFIVDWLRRDSKAATQWLNSASSIPPAQSAAWQREAQLTY